MRKLGFVSFSLFATLVVACVGDDPAPTVVAPTDGGVTTGTDAGGGVDGGGGGDSGVTAPPTHAPSSIAFVDTDPASGNVKGTVTIGKAADESDVTSYKLYWGSNATTKLSAITNIAVTGTDVTYNLTGAVPQGATHLLAFSANAAGEMSTGVSATPIDNFPVYTDISTGQGTNSGTEPFAFIDAANKKVLVAVDAGDNGSRPALYRCNLDGTGCTFHDISAGQGTGSGGTPKGVVDTAGNKILVLTRNGSSPKPALFRCDIDGTNCTYVDVSAGTGPVSAYKISAPIIDSTNNKLLFVTENESTTGFGKPYVFRCNLDGTSCTATDISSGQGNNSGMSPTIAIAGGKLSVVTNNGANNQRPALFRCNLDVTGCTYADISDGSSSSGMQPSLVIDNTTSKMLLVNYNGAASGKPYLTRCGFEGNICTHVDLSAGQGADCGYYPNAMLDPVANRLYVASQNGANNQKPALFACNSDGTNCSYADVSSGQGAAATIGAAFDASGKRVLIATENAGNVSKLALFEIGAW